MAKTVKQVKENISTTNEHRDTKIAELAYYKAENRGFEAGYEDEDWFAAEQELNSIMPADSQASSLAIADVKSKVVSAKNAGGGHSSVALEDLITGDKIVHVKVVAVKAVRTKAAAGKSIAVKSAKDKAV
jgi:hypothetical protein